MRSWKKIVVVTVALGALVTLVWAVWPRFIEWRLTVQLDSDDRATWSGAVEALLERRVERVIPAITRACLEKAPEEFDEWERRVVEAFPLDYDAAAPVYEWGLLHEDESIRRAALIALENDVVWSRRAAIPVWIASLESPHEDVVFAACEALESRPVFSREAVKKLLALERSREWALGFAPFLDAILSIGIVGDAERLLELISEVDTEDEIAFSAASELSRRGAVLITALPELEKLLGHSHPRVRVCAAVAVSGAGSAAREFQPRLLELLCDDSAIDWWGEWDDSVVLSRLPLLDATNEALVPTLVRIVRADWAKLKTVRADAAVRVLGELSEQPTAAAGALVELVTTIPSWNVESGFSHRFAGTAFELARALASHGSAVVQPLAGVLSSDESGSVSCFVAAFAAGELGAAADHSRVTLRAEDRRVLNDALDGFRDLNRLRAVGLWARRRLGVREPMLGVFLDVLADDPHEIISIMTDRLPRPEILVDVDASSLPRLRRAVEEGLVAESGFAYSSLAQLEDVGWLISVLESDEGSTYDFEESIRALSAFEQHAPRIVPVFVSELEQTSSRVLCRGLEHLGRSAQSAASALRDLATRKGPGGVESKDPVEVAHDLDVYQAALSALVAVAPSDASTAHVVLDALARWKHDFAPAIRFAGLELSDPASIDRVRLLLHHRIFEVRIEAARLWWRSTRNFETLLPILRWGLASSGAVSEFVDEADGPIGTDSCPFVRRAIDVIREIGPSAGELAGELREFLEFDDPPLLLETARALWSVREESHADAVARAVRLLSPSELELADVEPYLDLLAEFAATDPAAIEALSDLRVWLRALEIRQKIDAILARSGRAAAARESTQSPTE